jgi:multiple antibiotic resistance protein
VLIFFALTGFWIFKIYSITIDAFRIAGGIVLLIIGLNMLFPKEGADKIKAYSSQIYIVPLAIPMTSGPGAITTTVLLASNVANLWQEFMLWGAIFSACAINYIVLRFSENIDKILGREGLSAMIKIMGLFVASIGVQFIITGIKAVFPILG